MNPMDVDRSFTGSIPQLYEQLLVPLIFAPYAADLAARTAQQRPMKVLEIAVLSKTTPRQSPGCLPTCHEVRVMGWVEKWVRMGKVSQCCLASKELSVDTIS